MAWTRHDAAEVVERDGLRYLGATRRAVDAAIAAVPADDSILFVAAGQMARYHALVPAPEQALGAIAISERGVGVSMRAGLRAFDSVHLPWESFVHAHVACSGLSGLSVDVATNKARYVLHEQFRGPKTPDRAQRIADALREHLPQREGC